MQILKKLQLLLLLSIVLLSSCSKEDENVPSSEKDIISFSIEGIETKIENNQIIVTLPASSNNTLYTPTIVVSDKAHVYPESGTEVNFEEITNYTVYAEDNSEKTYDVVINRLEGIRSVGVNYKSKYGQTITCEGVVDEQAKTITIDMPYGSLGSESFFYISFQGDSYSTSVPKTGDAIDGEGQTILYDKVSLFNEDYSKKTDYKLIVRNTEAELIKIDLPLRSYGISYISAITTYEKYREGLEDRDLVYFVLEGQDLSNVKPSLVCSKNATIKPSSEESVDFRNIVSFEITSESGYSVQKKVKVVEKKIIIVNDQDYRSSTPIENGNFIIYYDAISKIKEASLTSVDTKQVYPCTLGGTVQKPEGSYYVNISTNSNLAEGRYHLKVVLENGDKVDTDTYCTPYKRN